MDFSLKNIWGDEIKYKRKPEWLFRAYMGIFVWEISQIRLERLAELRDSDFYKDGIFSKYHITALSYADDKVKSIVTKNPDQPLKDAKFQLEELAKSDGNLKCDLAYFYACAVLEWHLNGNNSQ